MGIFNFIGKIIKDSMRGIPSTGSVVRAGNGDRNYWGIYCSGRRILTVAPTSSGSGREIAVIPDTLFMQLSHCNYYVHFINSESDSFRIDSESWSKALNMRGMSYYDSAQFVIGELCHNIRPEQLKYREIRVSLD